MSDDRFNECVDRLSKVEQDIPSAPFIFCLLGGSLFIAVVMLVTA